MNSCIAAGRRLNENIMRHVTLVLTGAKTVFLLAAAFLLNTGHAQSSVNVRLMAANLNGNTQSYQPFALRILQGLKPDVVCIQEFNYSNNAASDFRYLLDTTLGTNFVYYREPFTASGDIPNGIISRWPILAAGSWADAQQSQPNRGFAWAQIQLPGTNSLYVVSVHLLTSSATARSAEASALQTLMQANFPANAWVVLAGDFNTDSRTEATTMTTFDSFLSDFPVPADCIYSPPALMSTYFVDQWSRKDIRDNQNFKCLQFHLSLVLTTHG